MKKPGWNAAWMNSAGCASRNCRHLDEFIESNIGAWTRPAVKPAIAFEDFRADPERHPLNTPSGKIEIFSKQLFDLGQPDEIPAVPKYIQEWESPFDQRQSLSPASHRPSHPAPCPFHA